MKRWIPHIHVGEAFTECVLDLHVGRAGYYLEICWFGWQLSIGVASRRRENRLVGKILAPAPVVTPWDDTQ